MKTKAGRAVISSRRKKGRKKLSAWVIIKRKSQIKFETIKRKVDFSRVLNKGIYRRNKYLTIYLLKKPDSSDGLRVGFIISKKIGVAVLRNRIKRVIKEVLRRSEVKLTGSIDALFIVKKGADGVNLKELKNELRNNLSLFNNS